MKPAEVKGAGMILGQKEELRGRRWGGTDGRTGFGQTFALVRSPRHPSPAVRRGRCAATPRRPPSRGLTYLRRSGGPGWCRTILSPKRCSAWCPDKAGARSCCPGSHCSSPPSWHGRAGGPLPLSYGRRQSLFRCGPWGAAAWPAEKPETVCRLTREPPSYCPPCPLSCSFPPKDSRCQTLRKESYALGSST